MHLDPFTNAQLKWSRLGYGTVIISDGQSRVWDHKAFYVHTQAGTRYPFDTAAMAQKICELAYTKQGTDSSPMYAVDFGPPTRGGIEFSVLTERGANKPIRLSGTISKSGRVFFKNSVQNASVYWPW